MQLVHLEHTDENRLLFSHFSLYQTLSTEYSTILYTPLTSTPKNYQFQISQCSLTRNITSHSIKNLALIAYSDERWLYYQFSLPHLYTGWENVLFELWEWKGWCFLQIPSSTEQFSNLNRKMEAIFQTLLPLPNALVGFSVLMRFRRLDKITCFFPKTITTVEHWGTELPFTVHYC